MDLHVLFVQRRESYVGEHAPEARLVWDEFSIDANPDGFAHEIAEEVSKLSDDIVASRVIAISVDQAEIRKLLVETPTLPGRIEE